MPLVAIDLLEGRSKEELDAIADAVHGAMVDHLDVPARDRFAIITEHSERTCASIRTTWTSSGTMGSCSCASPCRPAGPQMRSRASYVEIPPEDWR